MSLAEVCVEAEAVIGRMRALFGNPVAINDAPFAAGRLTAAAGTVTAAVRGTDGLSGAGVEGYRSAAAASLPGLRAAATADSLLGGQIRAAGAVTAAGAARMDQIAAATAAISRSAPMARGVPAQRMVLGALRSQVAQAGQVVEAAQRQLGVLAGQVHALDYRGGAPADAPLAPAPAPPPALPPPSSTPEQIKQWWAERDPAARAYLIARDPDLIGNLDGIPAADRDAANRTMMGVDRAKVDQMAAARHVGVDEIRAHPQDYGLSDVDLMRYDNAGKVQEGLDATKARTGADTLVLSYKPEAFGGQGRAAIAINNPDRADNVAVVVPGTGHSVAEGWLSAPDAANLYGEMTAADPTFSRSVIAWMGYDAPDGFTDGRIASTGLAHEGGALLAHDVNGLRATHEGVGHWTVIGHSYGSTVVADGAVLGMRTNDVALIGSPGTDLARSAADFQLPSGGHVFAGSASTDPITQLGKLPTIPFPGQSATLGLGPDPSADGFGSTRFRAEVPGVTWNDHSHYYDRGSESARSLGLIAVGRGDALQSHGLTAPHRPGLAEQALGIAIAGPLGPFVDPELPRLPGQAGRHR